MKSIKTLAAAVLALTAVACSSPEKMAKQAENVTVSCDPAVLEVVAGKIEATVKVTYPADYFNPRAILEVTPVIVYDGGEAAAPVITYQGEKVKDNFKVVSKAGQTVTEKLTFDYVEGMEQCYLELRGVAKKAKNPAKSAVLPAKKVADGANTTYMLVETDGTLSYKADAYQDVIAQTAEGQILYSINSAEVAGKQLKGQSIKDFQAALDEIKANERKTLKGTEVVAYASPDGGEALNTKLSDKRSKTAEKAWTKVVKGKDVKNPEVKSVGQDWEGFKELVSESNIQDKDLIIRVLNMYSDPAVRESEIKNISEVYTELKKGVLPELRRARFIANVEYKNYTAEELAALVDENIDVLDEEAVLRAAANAKALDKKIELYKKAVEKFDSDRAQYNLAVALLKKGDNAAAKKALAAVKADDADVQNAKGVIALRNNDLAAAAKAFAASGNDDAKANQAVVDILNGNYDAAYAALKDKKGGNAALAALLTNNTEAAIAKACPCPHGSYIKAVASARLGKADDVKKYLEIASKNSALKARAAKDIEFVDFR